MENLAKYKLGDIAYIIGGVAYNPADICDNGIRILRGGNIQNKAIVTKSDDVFLPLEYSNCENQIRVGDTILVASTGSVEVLGKAATCFSDLPNTQIGAFMRIVRPKRPEYAMLISIALTSDYFARYIKAQAKGTSINNITIGYLKNFNIMCPHSFEPICSLYSKIEAKIALNREINRNLEAQLSLYVDEIISSHSYDYKSICDIAKIGAGGDCPKYFSNVRTPVYNIPIYSNGIISEGLYGYAKKSAKTISERTVTIAARGTIGATFRRIEPFLPIIRLIYVAPFDLGADVWIHQIVKRMRFEKNGSVQQQLTVPEVSQFRIPYPQQEVLSAFESETTPIVEMIGKLKEEIDILSKQRDELLPLLMNGQVSVRPTAVNCDLSD